MRNLALLVLIALAAVFSMATSLSSQAAPPRPSEVNEHALRGERNFLTGHEASNGDGTYNMVVEIPTGTSQKWEICTVASLAEPAKYPGCTAAGREMVHEVRDGARRVIRHIGYPGNYGAIPRTRAGDGDPLDVIAIGPAAQRGTVIPVRIVGVIRCMDGDDQDDKLVAITRDSPLHGVSSAAELEAKAPQAADIIFRWFMSYKGADAMACSPMADQTVAAALIAEGRSAFTAP